MRQFLSALYQGCLERKRSLRRGSLRGNPVRGNFEALETRRLLAVLNVNSTADNLTADSNLTLREATLLVNNGGNAIAALNRLLTPAEIAQLDNTEAFGTNDTIQFATPGTIALGEQITLSRNVVIVGLGADVLTFDAGGANRVIEITSGRTVSISGVTITGGSVSGADRGGGILNAGNLTLDGVIVALNSSQNSGGGLYSSAGRLDVFQSSFDSNTAKFGAGVYVDASGSAPTKIDGSTFFGNLASVAGVGTGGGIYVSGAATAGSVAITNSTFSSNYAVNFSGALRAYSSAKVTIVNSTFAYNSAGINGGGIGSHLSSLVTIHNSILSANYAPNQANATGTFASSSAYNLVGTGAPLELRNAANQNIVSDDPGLRTLDYYGGLTRTHALEPDSLAVDAGIDALALSWGLNRDQRKSSRPVDSLTKANGPGGTTDIGAYELKLPGIADVVVSEDAFNTEIDLEAAFGFEAERADFEILTNTNPKLFSSVTIQEINLTTKLILNYAPDQSGPAYITVALHHASGVSDTLGFQVLVNPVNDAPTITAAAEDFIYETEILEFSAANGNAITIGDIESSGTLVELLSPQIPDVSYTGQNGSRLFYNSGDDDYSAYGFANTAVSLSSYLFDAGIGTSLNYFLNSTDEAIREQLALIPEKFDDPLIAGVRDDVDDWLEWVDGNPYAVVDIEGPAHPKEWREILQLYGIEKLYEVFDAYKRRIDLAHEMYPQLRLIVWGAPSVAASSAGIDFPYIEEQINTLDMAIQYGVFDNAYGFSPRVFQQWGKDDTSILQTDRIEKNIRAGAMGAQEAIKRAVEATNGAKGTHLKVVPNNSWTVLNTEENDPSNGTVNQGEESAEGYVRQLAALQGIAGGVAATIRRGANSEQIEIAQIPAVATSHLHRLELQPLDLNRFAQELPVIVSDLGLGKLEVTLTASHGTLNLSDIGQAQFIDGDGFNDSAMTLWGTQEQINSALDGLQFVPETGYFGDQAGITIEVDDQGTSGYSSSTIDIVVGKEFNVNVFNDVFDIGPVGDGLVDANVVLTGDQISLRAAILEANALTVPSRINLPAGQFDLTRTGVGIPSQGDLDIYGNVEIVGAGANLTIINAGGTTGIGDRVFEIASGSTVSISGVTITGGSVTGSEQGGGILNAGNLTLDGVIVAGNSSQSSGGGLYSSAGDLTVFQSSFDNNTAKYGGGIYLNTPGGALVRIDGSTFYGNEANVAGIGAGGAMFVRGGTSPGNVIITNSTFSANSAAQYSGALRAYNSSSVFIVNSTFTLNSAGISGGGIGSFDSSLVTVFNSIVSANTAPTQADANGSFASFSAYNLVGTGTPVALRNANNHIVVTNNPGLGALGYYGGPTRTHVLLSNSLAVDAGIDALATSWGITSDQRNSTRPVDYLSKPNGSGGTTDIGAYELQNPPAVVLEEEAASFSEDIDTLEDFDAAFEQLSTSSLTI